MAKIIDKAPVAVETLQSKIERVSYEQLTVGLGPDERGKIEPARGRTAAAQASHRMRKATLTGPSNVRRSFPDPKREARLCRPRDLEGATGSTSAPQ